MTKTLAALLAGFGLAVVSNVAYARGSGGGHAQLPPVVARPITTGTIAKTGHNSAMPSFVPNGGVVNGSAVSIAPIAPSVLFQNFGRHQGTGRAG